MHTGNLCYSKYDYEVTNISFAYWTRVKLLFVKIKPIIKGLWNDTPESNKKIPEVKIA